VNLNQVTIPVADIERAINFYEKIGLKLIVKELPHYARFECPEGDATFSLHRVHEKQLQNNVWVYFEVQNLDSYVQRLLKKGLVARRKTEGDARTYQLAVTIEGRAAVEQAKLIAHRVNRKLLSALPANKARDFLPSLELIIVAASRPRRRIRSKPTASA